MNVIVMVDAMLKWYKLFLLYLLVRPFYGLVGDVASSLIY